MAMSKKSGRTTGEERISRKTFQKSMEAKIQRELIMSQSRSPKLRTKANKKDRLATKAPLVMTLQDLPVDVLRMGILTNLLQQRPKFQGHYFEK
jgi:hypothetical protein